LGDLTQWVLKMILSIGGAAISGFATFRQTLQIEEIHVVIKYDKPLGIEFAYSDYFLGRKTYIQGLPPNRPVLRFFY